MALPPGLRKILRLAIGRAPAADVDSEFEFHIATKVEQLTAQGMAPEQARAEALRQFGSPESFAREVREIDHHATQDSNRREYWADVRHDFVLAFRGARRSPLFATVVAITFALGIGANAAVFSLLDAVLLRPLPYPEAGELVRIYEKDANREFGQVTIADFNDLKAQNTTLAEMGLFRFRRVPLTGAGDAAMLVGGEVSPQFFGILRVKPAIGRDFRVDDAVDGAPPVAILTWPAWRRIFGGDSSIVGRTARISDRETTIIGILPERYVSPVMDGVSSWDIYFTSDYTYLARDNARARRFHFATGFGRLKPGVTVEQAQRDFETIGLRLAAEYPDLNKGHTPRIVSLQESGTQSVSSTLWLVMGAVGLVLLIACANLANLVFARALGRSREFAVRSALGAGRGRIARQVFIEQLVLASFGLVIGLLGATWTSGLFVRLSSLPRGELVRTDSRVMLFAIAITALAAIASGILPALSAVRSDLTGTLRSGGYGSTLSRRSHGVRASLVATQVGLAAILLVGCGLALRSLSALLKQDLGFQSESVWFFTAPATSTRYPNPPDVVSFQERLIERVRGIPGVVSASAAYTIPMANVSTTSIIVEGAPAPEGPPPEIGYNAAETDYFKTLGIPLVAGRLMQATDRIDAPPVIVVNQALADRFYGGDAVGKRARMGPNPEDPWMEIVGVVGNIRRRGVDVAPEPEVYYPLSQDLDRAPMYVVRVSGDPTPVLARAKEEVRALDAEVVFGTPTPVADIISETLSPQRLLSALLGVFGGIALVLAGVGIYGVIAFLVAERRREIGVRMALGAQSGRVLREVVGRGMRPVAIGLALGLGAALILGRTVSGLFYHVKPTDPVSIGAAIGILLLAGVIGCLAPAIRAARTDPGGVLRE
jgi:predicted permease